MMTPNLRCFDRTIRFILAVLAFASAAFLFEGIVARTVVTLAGLWCLYESAFAVCPALAKLGATDAKKPLTKETIFLVVLNGIQALLAYEWGMAGYEKIMSGEFPSTLAATLAKFASSNPFAWVKAFLLGPATDNALLLGYAIEWSELVVAVLLVASVVISVTTRSRQLITAGRVMAVVALVAAMAMNASFFFAAGWLSASTHGVNMIMFWVEAMLFYAVCSMLLDKSKA